VQLEFGIPIGNVILTTDTDEQALVRCETKGFEAARRPSSSPICSKRSMANSGSARHRARECVLQGLYEAQLSGNAADVIRASLIADGSFANADHAYFDELWSGVNAESDALIRLIEVRIDRPVAQLSPIERAVLLIGAWELEHRSEIPFPRRHRRIDRAREIVRRDRRVQVRQRVLDKLAPALRAAEIDAMPSRAGAS
jgi:N utilization substance protein B